MTTISDKRRYLRYDLLDYAMTYRIGDGIGVRSVISDVGLGGLSLRTREPFAYGEVLRIVVGHADGTTLSLKGVVRHSVVMPDTDLFATGIQFLPDTHEERLAIAQYVNDAFQRQCDLITAEV